MVRHLAGVRLRAYLTVQRRDAAGTDVLRGCVLRRTDATGETSRELDTAEEWYATMTGLFGLDLGDLDAATRERLWTKTRTAHLAWRASREAPAGVRFSGTGPAGAVRRVGDHE